MKCHGRNCHECEFRSADGENRGGAEAFPGGRTPDRVCDRKRGVRFYNDSKGTNPDAAIQGIRAMNRPTLLIGGGYDKQSTYDEWIDAFDGKVKNWC